MTKKVGFRCVIDKAGSNFGDFQIDFLGEYEAICEMNQVHRALFDEKKPRVENIVTLSLYRTVFLISL
jgi:hypothetical protein